MKIHNQYQLKNILEKIKSGDLRTESFLKKKYSIIFETSMFISHMMEDISLIKVLFYFYNLKYENLQIYYSFLYKNGVNIKLLSFVINKTNSNNNIILDSSYICLSNSIDSTFDIIETKDFIKKHKLKDNNFKVNVITSTVNLDKLFKQNISIKQQKFCNNIEELIQHIIKKVLEIYNIDAYHNGSFATSTDYENYTYHNFVNNRNNSEKLLYNSHYKDMKSFIKSHNQGKNKYSSFDCIDCGNIIMMYIAYLKSKYLLYNIEAAQVHINANYSADFLHPIEYGGSHRIIVVTNKSEGKNKSFYNNLDCLKNDKDTYIIDILNKDNQYFSSIENVYCWVPDRLEGSFYSIKSAKEFSIEVISTLEEMLNYDGDYVQQKPSLCNIF